MTEPEVGVVAVSRAGHDKGHAFVILGREGDEYVLLADGRNRKAGKPKKKKLRHVHIEPAVAESVRETLLSGRTPTDAQLRTALTILGYRADTE